MCKQKVCIALVVLALPALMWADLLHPSISPVGIPVIPGFNSGGTGHNASVQVSGFSTAGGSNLANADVLSSQMSFNGTPGGTQGEQSDLSVDYTGTGSVQVNEGNGLLPILPMTSNIGLGLGMPVGFGMGLGMGMPMGLGTTSLGTIGLSGMLQPGLMGLGIQPYMPVLSGPWMMH